MGFTLSSESFSLFVVVTIALNGVLIHKVSCDGPLLAYETVFNWKELDYQFDASPPSTATRDELIKSGRFIRENNVITGVKVSGNRVFLTVPRWRTGVPATLVHLPYDPSSPVPANREVTNGPKLIPYPSWKMNEEGNCSALQYVQSMEIDQFDRMWVLDVGRVNIFGDAPDNKCPPKLVIIDLKTNSTVKSFEFPAEVVSRNSSFLNDIVVGCTTKDECWAYMTDARDAKVIVYNLQTNKSWFVKHSTMVSNPAALIINIQGENYTFDTSVDGIALSPLDTNFNTLYFSPLSSFDLYSVPSEVLQKAGDSSNGSGLELEDASIKHVGVKSSQTDGMAIDASGLLYFGLLGSNAINSWNSSYANLTDRNQAQLVQNDIDLQWPDTFGIDDKGYVFVTTNRLQRFSTNTYDFESINFRVIRFFVGIKSYMYSKNDMVEPNPVAEPEPEPVSAAEPEPEAEAEPTGTAEPEPTVQSDALEVETTPSAVAEPEPEVEPEAEAEPTSTNTSSSAVNKDSVIKPSDKNVYEVHQDHQHHHVTNHTDTSENEINNSIAGQSSQSQIHAGASTSSPVNTIFAVFIPLILLLTTLM